jgi:arabinogalactan endo-1,4-beta-galactosidase
MKRTFKKGLIVAAMLALNWALAANVSAATANYLAGADMSDLSYYESSGIVYKDNGQTGDALQILKNHGVNCIRLRLWTSSAAQAQSDPWDYNCNLDYVVPLAQRVKNDGLLFMLDFHYSDTWADPQHQAIPSAWASLSFTQLVQEMRTYNSNSIAALKNAGAMPDYVQVGNEISSGMLWPMGQVSVSSYNATQWSQLGQLMKAAVQGIQDAAGTNMPKIVIHVPWGTDWGSTETFFDNLQAQNVPFDIIGQSYYEWWVGPWQNVPNCLDNAAQRYGKPVIIAETCWPFMGNPSGYNGVPGTPAGQVEYVGDLGPIVTNVPNGLGGGIFW